MGKEKVWHCRWSNRKNKVYYVNIKNKQSSWKRPDNFIESQDELEKITEWKLKRSEQLSKKAPGSTPKKQGTAPATTPTTAASAHEKPITTPKLPSATSKTAASATKHPKKSPKKSPRKSGPTPNTTHQTSCSTPNIPHQKDNSISKESRKKSLPQEHDPKKETPKKRRFSDTLTKTSTPERKVSKRLFTTVPNCTVDLPKEDCLAKEPPKEQTPQKRKTPSQHQIKHSKPSPKLPQSLPKQPKTPTKSPQKGTSTPEKVSKASQKEGKRKQSTQSPGPKTPEVQQSGDEPTSAPEQNKTPPREFFESDRVATPGDKTPEYTTTPTRNFGNTPPFDKVSSKRPAESSRLKHKRVKVVHNGDNNGDNDDSILTNVAGEIMKDAASDTAINSQVEDYIEVFSDKRQMYYYYNLKTKTSQWKRPSCLQVADTLKAIENSRKKKERRSLGLTPQSNIVPVTPTFSLKADYRQFTNSNISFGSFDDDDSVEEEYDEEQEEEREEEHDEEDEEDDILLKSNLNVNAPSFEMGTKLNVNAQPFVPKSPSLPSLPLDPSPDKLLENGSLLDTPKINKSSRKGENARRLGTRKVTIKRRLSDPIRRKPTENKPADRMSAKDRLSLPECKMTPRSVHDRLGVRHSCDRTDALFSEAPSNVRLLEEDLIILPFLPPHPDTEVLRYTEVQKLRNLFSELCQEKLDLEEPTEAFNRWLLEQQLSRQPQHDPMLCFSDKKSKSLYREIMQDVPMKCKLPRGTRTCTDTLDKFVARMLDISKTLNDKDREQVVERCNKTLEKNKEFADTRALVFALREECHELTDKYYKPIVEGICEQMNQTSRQSALQIVEFGKESGFSEGLQTSSPPLNTSSKLVCCRPAQPPVSSAECRGTAQATFPGDRDRGTRQCSITCKELTMSINVSHFNKLRRLYTIAKVDTTDAKVDTTDEEGLFNCRVWCLMKRYKMLRSSMTGGKLQSENFGLHAALPRKAFELLNRKFHVSFECFASPFNCYFSQYCSAFPDIDCYFGSRGSFFDFKPKSGSFQANPPFSEEVMLAMANHMIGLLDDTTEPLMFIVFIPDWREPLTPAIPRLADTIYCTHSILLESGNHQYITGNQHVQGLTHYDAVHGTQVFVLQNDSAIDTWHIEHRCMLQLRHAMSYNREWG